MFDIGFLELLVVAVTALLVLGPERLPVLVRQLASWMARSRHFANQLKDEFEREANLGDISASLEKQKKEFDAQLRVYESELQQLKPEQEQIEAESNKYSTEKKRSGIKQDD